MPRFRADLGQLGDIRDFVSESAASLGASPDTLDELRIAVDEAVTNVVIHGYSGAGDVDIDVSGRGRDLVIRLRDQAPPFDPVRSAPDSLAPVEERVKPGGFGLYLIRENVDEVSYQRVGSDNELTLIKRGVINGAGS